MRVTGSRLCKCLSPALDAVCSSRSKRGDELADQIDQHDFDVFNITSPASVLNLKEYMSRSLTVQPYYKYQRPAHMNTDRES